MKIDFLLVDNTYDTAHHFSEHLGEALQKKGVRVRFLDLGNGNFYRVYRELREEPPDVTCSFSDITLAEGELLADALQIPHLTLLVDHVVYFLHHLKSNYSYVSCMDQEDVHFVKSLGFHRTFFLPHGVPNSLFENRERERLYDVVMIGSCYDYEKIQKRWKSKFSAKTRDLLEEAALKILGNENLSCLQVLLEAKVGKELPLLHYELENYVRGKDRIALLRSLKNVKVHIWGQGSWKKYLPEAVIHRSVTFKKALEIMGAAKIVLNSIPTFKYGGHERIFHALALGALPLTSATPYIEAEFPEGSIACYRYGKEEETLEMVQGLLVNEDRRKAMVEKGKKIVLAKHTWNTRAEQIIKFFSL